MRLTKNKLRQIIREELKNERMVAKRSRGIITDPYDELATNFDQIKDEMIRSDNPSHRQTAKKFDALLDKMARCLIDIENFIDSQ